MLEPCDDRGEEEGEQHRECKRDEELLREAQHRDDDHDRQQHGSRPRCLA